MKRKITVGLTGLNAIDSPGPGVSIARCLRETEDMEFRVIGLIYETLEPGIYLHDLVDKSYQIPYPSAGTGQLYKRISFIHERENLDMIIPSFDAELYNFIKLESRFAETGIKTFLPSRQQFDLISKLNLPDFVEKYNMPSPATFKINSLEEYEQIEEEIEFPMVIKGRYYEAYIVHNKEQVNYYYNKLNAKWGLPVIIQEFIDGTEIVIAGLGDGTGQVVGGVPLRKLSITDKGKGWAGVVVEDKEYMDILHRFIRNTRWKGGFEIELKRTEDGELYLLEINPRFPAWIFVAAAAGQNMPVEMVKMAFGEKPTLFTTYETGKMFVRYSWDHITDLKEFQQISTLGEL